jgi:hypothetical protein
MKLEQARQFALSLPEATEEPHFDYTSFRIRGKIFATAPPDGAHLHVFVEEEQRETALAMHPSVCEKLSWGAKVVGLRVALVKAPPAFVHELLRAAWQRKAPKKLVQQQVV